MRFPANVALEKSKLLWSVFSFVLVMTQTSVKGAPGTRIGLEPYVNMAEVGESFTIDVTITDVQNLYGVEVTLLWNTSILNMVTADVRLGVESHPDGVLLEPVFVAKNGTISEGRYLLAGTSTLPAASFNGSGNIVRITFKVINAGSCKLDLETELRGKPVPGHVAPKIIHNTINGFFGPQIAISALPSMTPAGEEVDIDGSIIPARADVQVTILHRIEGEDWRTLATVGTDDQGQYHHSWRVRERGEHEIRATANIDGQRATSPSAFVNAVTRQQPLWMFAIIIITVVVGGVATVLIYIRRTKKS